MDHTLHPVPSISEDSLPPPSPPFPEATLPLAVMWPTPLEWSMSPRGPLMPSPSPRPMLTPMPTTAMVWDTTVMDTATDTVSVTDPLDTAALAMGLVTVTGTTVTVTVWDTTVTTVARGPLMLSQKLMLMPMLTTGTTVTV